MLLKAEQWWILLHPLYIPWAVATIEHHKNVSKIVNMFYTNKPI